MRELSVQAIRQAVRDLCIQTNIYLPSDIADSLQAAAEQEDGALAKEVLCDLCRNAKEAAAHHLPICQDTGMAVVWIELGQDVHLIEGDLEEAVNQGVREGYQEGYLRCSVVADPLRRENTGDNTPAVLYVRVVPGEQVAITVAPKGFGSENMSRSKMFTPAATREDIIQFVVDCVQQAGSNPCPPVVVGVGIGGTFDYCAQLSKRALMREEQAASDPFYRAMEEEMLQRINQTGIGPQGFGGHTTALSVRVETYPTHIAGLPVCVNMGCHVTRHGRCVL